MVFLLSLRTVRVRVPANYVGDIEKDVNLALAIELFLRGLISIGRAAEIAGLPIQDFIYELKKRGIKPFSYDEEDIREELEK